MRALALLLGLLIALMLLLAACRAGAADTIPRDAQQYRRDLVRAAHQGMGLSAPIATLAGQIHQESRWRADAASPAGAQGLAQFMPATAAWMADARPRQLGPADPWNPGWALRALVVYDGWLLDQLAAADACEHWAFALSGYNGGLGWVQRDQRLAQAAGADPTRWFGHVANHTGRADWARSENRAYVRRILTRWEPLYAAAGWGAGVCGALDLANASMSSYFLRRAGMSGARA